MSAYEIESLSREQIAETIEKVARCLAGGWRLDREGEGVPGIAGPDGMRLRFGLVGERHLDFVSGELSSTHRLPVIEHLEATLWFAFEGESARDLACRIAIDLLPRYEAVYGRVRKGLRA